MEADYVIVGAGSAGCALANRLSEANKSVLVIEFGGSDAGPLIQMPAALSYPMNMSRYDWGYRTEPEPYLGGRKLVCPRGKVVGGSSSINGMVYVRGHAKDFDTWADMGAGGWSYADVVPYFERMETWNDAGHGGDSNWRGRDGPLHVTRGPMHNQLVRAFIEAGKEAGYQTTSDYNGQKQEGFGPMEHTIHRGQRWSSAKAYLKPALERPNCDLIRGLVHKIVFSENRAIGVEIKSAGVMQIVHARCEVIVAASSINSPKLLMLSGIGPAAHLREHGIPIITDRAGVGQNLQDHLELYLQMAASKPVSLYKYWNLISKAGIGLSWLLGGQGLGASNHFESCAFIRSAAGVEYPDLQYHFLPLAVRYDGKVAAEGHGFQVHVGPMRSPSRGQVTLKSSDPNMPPNILFNYMSHEKDWIDFRKAIKLTREIFAQKAFSQFIKHEIQPGSHMQTEDELNGFIKEHVESAYHPCGTCKMGSTEDPMAVVDPFNSVIGVDSLRVADSSIFPSITNGNLNGPSIMVGEKASDHILGKLALPKSNKLAWISENWRTEQR